MPPERFNVSQKCTEEVASKQLSCRVSAFTLAKITKVAFGQSGSVKKTPPRPPLALGLLFKHENAFNLPLFEKTYNIKNVNIKQTKRKPHKSSFYREHSHCISFVYGGHESLLIRQQNVSRLESTYHIT